MKLRSAARNAASLALILTRLPSYAKHREFEGTTKGWNAPPRLGHLPGAVHLDWTDLFDADDWTLKPAAELTTILAANGITPEATVVSY